MYLRIVWILLISILTIGCSSSSDKITKPKISKPNWILNPGTSNGQNAVSASAKFFQNGDKKLQKEVAEMIAEALISKDKQVSISSFCVRETSKRGDVTNECKSELTSVDFTKGVKIINEWVDKETNTLYIRAISKEKDCVGCGDVASIKASRPIKESNTIVSLSYNKDFTNKKSFSKEEQKKCALINAELALSEKLNKTPNEMMKESRKSNKSNYQIDLPCVSKDNIKNLFKKVELLKGNNNNSYKAWKVKGSDILYIWAW